MKPVNLPYQLVLFDFDGTLCHTEDVDIEAIQKTYQAFKKPIPTVEKIQATLRKGLIAKEILQHLSPDAPLYEIQQLLLTYKTMYQAQADSAELFNGVLPLLKQLKEAGILSVIVSNKAIDLLNAAVASLHIRNYFKKVIGLSKESLGKPNLSVWEYKIKPHFPAISLDKVLMVGDTSTDLKFAQALQIDSAWAAYGLGDPNHCRNLQPTYILQQAKDLLDIVMQAH